MYMYLDVYQIPQCQKMYEFETLNFLSLRRAQVIIVNWVDPVWHAIPDPSGSDII